MTLKEKYNQIVEGAKVIKQVTGHLTPVIFIDRPETTEMIMLYNVDSRTDFQEAVKDMIKEYQPLNELILVTETFAKKIDTETGEMTESSAITVVYVSHEEQFCTLITYTDKDGKITFTEELKSTLMDSWLVDAFKGMLSGKNAIH